jgi:hypothetical protein
MYVVFHAGRWGDPLPCMKHNILVHTHAWQAATSPSFKHNFGKEKSMLPEDDQMIETWRSF